MSYNTRRSGPQQPPQQQAASVGQRRPVVTNNFVAASQQSGQQQQQQQQRAPQPQQQQQRPAQQPGQQASQIQFRQQQQPVKPAGPQQTQNYQSQSFVKQEPATTPVRPAPAAAAAPVVPGANPPPPETSNGDSMDTDDTTRKKKPWMMKGGKISKKEKLRRRNLRLSKMLQPKNAVMILNELVKNTHYTVEELGCKVDNNQYKAVVTFEGEDHVGLGRSKIQAKNSAAEAALKYLIKNKQLKLAKSEPEGDDPMDGNESMELTTEDGTAVLPWQHVASFALFKLFSSWGEDPMGPVRQAQELLGTIPTAKPPMAPGTRHELKPAKALPANPETMNPIMLLNQMQPNVQYEEVGKSGLPPNVTFTYNVFVNEQTFTGTGNNKKAAKKMAAYAACHSVYNIHYPADVWTPLS